MQFSGKKLHLKVSLNLFILSSIIVSIFLFLNTTKFNDFILFFLISIIFLFFLNKIDIDYNAKYFSAIVFFAKFILLILFSISNDVIIFPDSQNYILNLDKIINSGDFSFQNIYSTTWTLHVGHYYYMLIPYSIFKTPISIILTNTLLVSVSIILFYKVVDKQFGNRIAFFTLVFSSLSLNLVLFGSFILKDSVVIFLGSLILYFLIVKEKKIIIPVILSIFLFTVRIYTGFAFLSLVVMFILLDKNTSKSIKFFGFIGSIVFLYLFSLIPTASSYINLSMDYISQNINSGTILNSVSAVAKFFFAPLPWNVISQYDQYTILLFDSFVFFLLSFALLMFILKFIKFKEMRNIMWIYIIPIIIHAVVLTAEYDGDSTRQRIGVFMFLILIYSVGLFYKREKTKTAE